MAKTDQVYEAIDTFIVEIDGVPQTVEKHVTRVAASSAIYKSNPHMFKPLALPVQDEQATAAPGEQRGEEISVTDTGVVIGTPEAKTTAKASSRK